MHARNIRLLLAISLPLALLSAASERAIVVPTSLAMPGTQPGVQMPEALDDCGACHGGYDLDAEPLHTARGSMMLHSGRDPLFWGQLAVAEQDFPGAGDFCIRCHVPVGWLSLRALPTDGRALQDGDAEGVRCVLCHRMTNPDDSEFQGLQDEPFVANDGGDPPEGYYGAGMLSIWAGFEKMGPYRPTDVDAAHEIDQSRFHRSSDMCGSCHDVSNPAVGNLSPYNGAMTPLVPSSFDGLIDGPVDGKAAFNNPPYRYGIIERTYSEHASSLLARTRVADYPSLPVDLRRGALEEAYKAALLAGNGGDYADGTERLFSCQSCHMRPTRADGCVLPGVRPKVDLPVHDLTGGNYWAPDAIRWLDERGRLRLGGGLTNHERDALERGKQRALHNLRQAAALEVDRAAARLKIINLTGHKLISGYPEGRRMFLNVRWYGAGGQLVREDGAYGTLDVLIDGEPAQVESLLDLDSPRTRVYQAVNGMTKEWGQRMIQIGFDPALVLSYDRITGQPNHTLGQLAAQAPSSHHETFHFILNNTIVSDNRIPPYGMDRDEAEKRNALPVPATAFGNPAPGGVYEHFDDVQLTPPVGATRAEVELLYQTASWEYIQFLLLANPGTSAFLASAGQELFDAYMATGQSTPEVMATARWCEMHGTNEDAVMRTSIDSATPDATCAKRVEGGDVMHFEITTPNGTHTSSIGALVLQLHQPAAPPISGLLPGLWLNEVEGYVPIIGVPPTGWNWSITMPASVVGSLRWQALLFMPNPANGFFALTDAFDFYQG
ncbi:MAG: hypothetical protein KDC48_14955 [Planctomycetes bacterium]|nr:hypothetical protein [Planctomycetota bacterium]